MAGVVLGQCHIALSASGGTCYSGTAASLPSPLAHLPACQHSPVQAAHPSPPVTLAHHVGHPPPSSLHHPTLRPAGLVVAMLTWREMTRLKVCRTERSSLGLLA